MGKPLVRFCEGQEFNCDMVEILWHRRESRRQTEKTNFDLQSREAPAYSKTRESDQQGIIKIGVVKLGSGTKAQLLEFKKSRNQEFKNPGYESLSR